MYRHIFATKAPSRRRESQSHVAQKPIRRNRRINVQYITSTPHRQAVFENHELRGHLLGFLLFRGEPHRNAVHAIAQAGGLRPVGEDVAQMTVAVRTPDFSLRRRKRNDNMQESIRGGLNRTEPNRSKHPSFVTETWSCPCRKNLSEL